MQPKIEFIPLREALCAEIATTLDILVRITPPQPVLEKERPSLNLSLVLDRSGSMSGQNKMPFTKKAASYAVEQLLPSDRVSIVIFDDHVDTLVPSQLAQNKTSILNQIKPIQPRGSTALHGGWIEGGVQVSQHLNSDCLNRVILLSDGLANIGETNPDAIASDVRGLAQRSVSTTTMGVGDNYNENLLEAMAVSGDGNYYYIESPDQLPEIFSMELQGLMATVGRKVSLGLEVPNEVQLLDVFNDFEKRVDGQYQLPNLIAGSPFTLGLRLKIPAQQLQSILTVGLAWDDVEIGKRQQVYETLTLPEVNRQSFEALPFNSEVQQEVASLLAARAKLEAAEQAQRGEYALAQQTMERGLSEVQAAPESAAMSQELESLQSLSKDLNARQYAKFSKRGHYESHSRSRAFSQSRYQDYQKQRNQRFNSSPSSGVPISELLTHVQGVEQRFKVVKGDITQIAVDAIVNATNPLMTGTSGVDWAIHRAAGQELQKACASLGTCNPGEAKLTPAFNLPAQWVIHTVGPSWQQGVKREKETLRDCYTNSLNLAKQQGAKTVSFPAIGTGAMGCPSDWAAEIALRNAIQFLIRNSSFEKIIFVCWDDDNYGSYQALLK